MMWSYHILCMTDRKGVGDFVPDTSVFHGVFHKMQDEDQNVIELNVAGAFQTAAQKAKWDEEMTDQCELC